MCLYKSREVMGGSVITNMADIIFEVRFTDVSQSLSKSDTRRVKANLPVLHKSMLIEERHPHLLSVKSLSRVGYLNCAVPKPL